MYNFDSFNVLLSIATNIPQRLKTASVLQGHILSTVLILNVLKLSRCDSSITIRSAPLADRHRWLRFSVALGIVGVWEVACARQALTAVLDWTRRDATPRRSLYCKPPAVFRALAFHASRWSPRVYAPRRALSAPAEKHKHGNIALNTLVPFLNSSHSTAACALLVFMLQCYILLSLPTNVSNAQTAHVGIKHDIMLYLCAGSFTHQCRPSEESGCVWTNNCCWASTEDVYIDRLI